MSFSLLCASSLLPTLNDAPEFTIWLLISQNFKSEVIAEKCVIPETLFHSPFSCSWLRWAESHTVTGGARL